MIRPTKTESKHDAGFTAGSDGERSSNRERVLRLDRVTAHDSMQVGLQYLADQVRRVGVYLVPLRLFIGLGWLRAFAEKAVEPGWYNGASLEAFLSGQLSDGEVVFPLYQALILNVFLPNALVLSWVIMLGQLLVGIAIFTGTLTNAALLGGLFMNLNFLLAGVPDPSAFYIVIQTVLLLANTGAILGVDAIISRRIHHSLAAAQAEPIPRCIRAERRLFFLATVVSIAIAGYGFVHMSDFSPAGSVHDPAMILTVLAIMGGASALLAYLRRHPTFARASIGLNGGEATERRQQARRKA